MDRDKLKINYVDIIRNQINMCEPISTEGMYHELLENGYDEERAVDVLAFCMENLIRDMLQNEKNFDEEKWNQRLSELYIYNLEEADKLTKYHMQKITGKLKKEFGSIKHGEEEPYLEGLLAYEKNLLILAERYVLNSGQLRTIVEIWMHLLYGSWHEKTYDFSAVADQDLIEMAKDMDFHSNPLRNPELLDILNVNPDAEGLSTDQIYEKSITMGLRLLVRIHDSMDFWEKEMGSNGYLKYLTAFVVSEK